MSTIALPTNGHSSVATTTPLSFVIGFSGALLPNGAAWTRKACTSTEGTGVTLAFSSAVYRVCPTPGWNVFSSAGVVSACALKLCETLRGNFTEFAGWSAGGLIRGACGATSFTALTNGEEKLADFSCSGVSDCG